MEIKRVEELLEELGRQLPPEYCLSPEIREKLLQKMREDAQKEGRQNGDDEQQEQ